MKKLSIKFNPKVRSFSMDEDPPEDDDQEGTEEEEVPEQPEEPIDYLHGVPATVLDLRNPIFHYNDGELTETAREKTDNDPELEAQLPEMEENYKDVISNLNKESAINHRLNDLGSTQYDLTGERSRREATGGLDALEYAASDPKKNNEDETAYIGAVTLPDNPERVSPKLNHHIDLGNLTSHELGHLNDPNMDENVIYGPKNNDPVDVRLRYGNKFADAYSRFKSPFGNKSDSELDLGDQIAMGHDHTPFEVYADAAAMRSALFKSGAWNGKDPITEDMVTRYLDSENQFLNSVKNGKVDYYPDDLNFNYGSTNQRMAQFFNTDDIVKILNSQRRYSISSDSKVRIFSDDDDESEDDDPPNDDQPAWIAGAQAALNDYLNGRSESNDVDEPTDYLKGIPATVLDLKEPVFEFDPKDPTFGSNMNSYDEKTDEDKVKDLVSDLNKESAINHRLNELGSTDYDLSGEGSRRVVINSRGSLADSGAASNPLNWLETLFTGYKNKYGIDPKYSQDDVYAHELGHMNDPEMSRFGKLDYGDVITDKDVKKAYGNDFADAYKNYYENNPFSEDHDHTPFEVYADAAALRSNLLKSGAWDGSSKITPEMVTNYLDSEREFLNTVNDGEYTWGPFTYGSPSQRIDDQFSTEDLVKILNSSRRYSYTDEYLQDHVTDDDLTVDTKEFIGVKEPNRPFHRTTFRYNVK